MKKPYVLNEIEEIIVLSLRIEQEKHDVLFVKGMPYHDTAVKKIERMCKRIEKLGGNPSAKLKITLEDEG